MEKTKEYKISLIGEFVDKSMENEFLDQSMSGYSKAIAFVTVLFGVICMLFLGNDYYAVSACSFLIITVTRVLFLITSIVVFFATKQTIKCKILFT